MGVGKKSMPAAAALALNGARSARGSCSVIAPRAAERKPAFEWLRRRAASAPPRAPRKH